MIQIRSSWIVEDGYARPLGEPRRTFGYHCSGCGERGHTFRTCGMTDEQRRARRHSKP